MPSDIQSNLSPELSVLGEAPDRDKKLSYTDFLPNSVVHAQRYPRQRQLQRHEIDEIRRSIEEDEYERMRNVSP